MLRNVGHDLGFVPLVLWGCGALFLATLVSGAASKPGSDILSMLSPDIRSLFLFGASGAVPMFGYHRWWTPLSAGWLHGGILHIVLNMMCFRDLGPVTAHLYGAARTVIIYTVASIVGFLASSVVGAFVSPFMPDFLLRFLGGAGYTVGASASIFGLIGALLWYGRRGGSRHLSQQAKTMALGMLLFGFAVRGIDNWAHLGGLAGGWITARILDPLTPERGDHVILAIVCLALSAASVVASVVVGLPER